MSEQRLRASLPQQVTLAINGSRHAGAGGGGGVQCSRVAVLGSRCGGGGNLFGIKKIYLPGPLTCTKNSGVERCVTVQIMASQEKNDKMFMQLPGVSYTGMCRPMQRGRDFETPDLDNFILR